MGLFDDIKGFIKSNGISSLTSKNPNPVEQKYLAGWRPVEQNPYSQFNSDAAKIPNIPLGFKFCFDLYNYNDVVRTIVRTLVGETFRNGISVQPRFHMKCNVCHYEFDSEVDSCKNCGNEKDSEAGFRKPDQDEKRILEEKMKDVNLNDETVKDVLMAVGVDMNVIDNAFLVTTKEYGFDADGEVVTAQVKEVLRGSPIALKLVQNLQGRFGRTDDNRYVMFCLDHRTEKYELKEDEVRDDKKRRCKVCNLKMYPAYYVYDQTGYVTPVRSGLSKVYYTNGEILHFKKFSHGIAYGFPPVLSIWQKALILMKMDWFILQAYNLQRPPKGMLVMKGTRESISKAWEKTKDEARMNPHMIYPIIIEPDEKESAKTVAEWVDFSYKSDDVDMIEYRNELRRAIGALWGVSPLFQADTSTGVGLANEGLQLTVTNRAVEAEQTLYNEKILEWLVKQFGISDWKIVVNPNEEKDQTAKLQRETMRMDIALKLMQGFGIKPKFKQGVDGIEFEFEQPSDLDKVIMEIMAYASANKIQVDVNTIAQMLSTGGQQSLIAGASMGGNNMNQQNQSQQGQASSGDVIGVTNGQGGLDKMDDGRSSMNRQGMEPPNPDGKNEKNPLNQDGSREGEPKPEGSPKSGRVRRNNPRFSGEPTGQRKQNGQNS